MASYLAMVRKKGITATTSLPSRWLRKNANTTTASSGSTYWSKRAKHAKGRYKALIVEYDRDFKYLKDRPADFTFESGNKGFEAIAHVRRGNKDYLLALCEGNNCKGGRKGRTPGGRRIQVFEKSIKRWRHCYGIHLPACLPWSCGGCVTRNLYGWATSMSKNGLGPTKEAFTSSRDQPMVQSCMENIEGVAWICSARVVTVSDRRKKRTQPDAALSEKDRSVHIFEIV